MGGINVKRWLMGGIAAAIVLFVIEGLGSALFMEDMVSAMEAHGLSFDISGSMMAMSLLLSLISGLVLIFFYAAARPRFGPGPKTAALVAVVFWLGGYLLMVIGFNMLGIFATSMLGAWAVVGLVETILAGLVGAWLYQE